MEQVLIITSLLIFVSVCASKLSTRLGIPALLVFLFTGMMVSGSDIEFISFFKNPIVAQKIGILTLVLVLFLGGLETNFSHMRPILASSIILSTFGVVITALIVGFFLQWVTRGYLGFTESLLLGTIVSSTDAAAVFSILGARNMRLKAGIGPLLESESGSNDVIVYALLLFLLKRLTLPNTSLYTFFPYFFQEMLLGGLGGVLLGYAMVVAMNKANLRYAGLYLPLLIAMLFFGYAIVNRVHGSGFLAVYIAAIILSHKDFIHKKSLIETFKGLSWLMQIIMFITFGLLVLPHKLQTIIPWGIQLSLLLIFIARPIAIFLSLIYSSFNFKHKLFISWVGLRGAVPIIFGTYLYKLPEDKATTLFHLIFFIVITSLLLQGTTISVLVGWLNLEDKSVQKGKKMPATPENAKKMLIELIVPKGSIADNKPIVELNFPKNALIALIYRDKRYLTAHGSTMIKADDKLLIMMDAKKDLKAIKASIGLKASQSEPLT